MLLKEKVLLEITEIVRNGPEKVYVSLHADAINPAFMAAVAAPELSGCNSREMIEILRTIAMSADPIGIEFYRIQPYAVSLSHFRTDRFVKN